MSSTSIPNFNPIDDNYKEKSPLKRTNIWIGIEIKVEISNLHISLNTNPNDLRLFPHMYYFMIYKLLRLWIQKAQIKNI
jgi:hypothetical protein